MRPIIAAALVCAALAASLGSTRPAALARPHGAPSPSPSPTGSPTPTPQERIATLSQTVRDNPNDRGAREELGVLFIQTGKPVEGRDQLENAARLGAEDAQIWFYIGVADRELGDAPDAVAALERAENLDPGNQAVLSNLTDTYLQLGRVDDARRMAKRSIQLHPKDAFAYEALATVLLSEAKFDEARTNLQQALAIDPKDVHAKILLGRSYLGQKNPNFSAAIAQFDAVLATDAKNVDALGAKADALGQKNDVAGAVAVLQQIVSLQPDRVDAQDNIGALYLSKNMLPQARAAFDQAVKDHPKAPEPYALQAEYDAKHRNYTQAAKEFESALAIDPTNARLLFDYGRLQLLAKQNFKAQDAFSKILRQQANDPEATFWLAQTYAAENQWPQARDEYRRAFELSHGYQALFGLGVAFYHLNDFKSARDAFGALAAHQDRNHPDPQLWFALGETERKLGERKGALMAYKRFLSYVPAGAVADKVRSYVKQLASSPQRSR
ncbi:MAG: tetratricopeptide repeat protein [Candidatus Eremiobacteraeota bacterium]|nr:tetratricopeptide repeat protein [Candidatus Eremiobacteraeota bacterium]